MLYPLGRYVQSPNSNLERRSFQQTYLPEEQLTVTNQRRSKFSVRTVKHNPSTQGLFQTRYTKLRILSSQQQINSGLCWLGCCFGNLTVSNPQGGREILAFVVILHPFGRHYYLRPRRTASLSRAGHVLVGILDTATVRRTNSAAPQ